MRKLLWVLATVWEIVYKNMKRAHFLKDSQQKLLRVAYRPYGGQPKEVDGQLIKKGDLVAELHLSNPRLRRYEKLNSPEWALYRDLIKELRLLGAIMEKSERPIKALSGITLFAPAAVRLGFSAEEIPKGLWSALNYLWLRILRKAFSPKKGADLKQLDSKRRPYVIWMSKERFLEKFSEAPAKDIT